MELVSKFGSLVLLFRKTNANSQLEQKLCISRALYKVFRNCGSKFFYLLAAGTDDIQMFSKVLL